jgi:hypothetical protein
MCDSSGRALAYQVLSSHMCLWAPYCTVQTHNTEYSIEHHCQIFTSLQNSCVEKFIPNVMAFGRRALRGDQVCPLDGITTLLRKLPGLPHGGLSENRDVY